MAEKHGFAHRIHGSAGNGNGSPGGLRFFPQAFCWTHGSTENLAAAEAKVVTVGGSGKVRIQVLINWFFILKLKKTWNINGLCSESCSI